MRAGNMMQKKPADSLLCGLSHTHRQTKDIHSHACGTHTHALQKPIHERKLTTYRGELEGGAALLALAGDVLVLGSAPQGDLLLLAVLVLVRDVLVGEAYSVVLALDLARRVLGHGRDARAVRAAAVV